MAPYLWSTWIHAAVAAVPIVWMLAIEFGTSRNASRQPDSTELEVETRTGRLVDVGAGIAIIGGLASSVWVEKLVISPRTAVYLLGLVLMFVALGISHVARNHLGRFHRDDLTRHANHELVASGPYQFVRHPLYTATGCGFLGIGLCLGTWLSVGLVILPIAALVHRIHIEEQMLDRALGPAYQRYAETRSRLIPYVW